ncbi:MAG: 2-dehydropantoate 2-reductase [Lachnospiraceae bacterium]|nr:2-dehydropantoate 2-reductase [Lachnospiraceae bacterium]
MDSKKIIVAGLGGVGGFLGAALASVYSDVTFFARGARKEHLKTNGLTLKSEFIGDKVVKPALVTDDAAEAGIADFLIISVKNYSLEQICRQLAPAVDEHTIIVPVLNGIDPADRTRQMFEKGIVVDSLIYIASGSEPDFSIVQKGNYTNLHIGTRSSDPRVKEAVEKVHSLFVPTGINCIMAEDIEAAIWKKYIFNCAFNVMTAAYSANVEDLRIVPEYVQDMENLMDEACLVARKKQVAIPDDLKEERIQFFMNLQSPTATSSLRRDIDAGRSSELETFSGYLLQEAPKYGVKLARTEYYYKLLKEKEEIHTLLDKLHASIEKNGAMHEETAACHYQLGLYYIKHANASDAMSHLGDALYIRRQYYTEDSLRIREIYYALEQCTFM